MTMKELGWKQLKGDKCAFVLMDKDDPNKLVGVAGIHVDDFLIGGDSSSTTFSESEAALLKTFRWGKWQEESFEFAGVNIRQNSDYSIFLDQESYTQKWLDEINMTRLALAVHHCSLARSQHSVESLELCHGGLRSLDHNFWRRQVYFFQRSSGAQ